MRIVLGLLLAVGVVLQLLLGGSLLFAAQEKGPEGLSVVSGDLVNEQELLRMKQEEAAARAKQNPYRTHRMVLGLALLALGTLQMVSTVMAFKQRAWMLVLVGTGLSLLATLVVLLVPAPQVPTGLNAGLEKVSITTGMEFVYITTGVLLASLVLALGSRLKKGNNA